jgi:DNA-binding MarR family transcriptional regulator
MTPAPPPAPTTETDRELASRLRLVITRLARRLRQEADADVTPSQISALATIERQGPVTLSELAAVERVQPPSMTRIVAALDDAGLVTRTVDPTDRRVARVTTTATGRRVLARTRTRKNAYLAARMRSLSADELATLERAALILEDIIEDRA